jgi:hypothetical protein
VRGHVFGVDGYAEKIGMIEHNPFLRPLVR